MKLSKTIFGKVNSTCELLYKRFYKVSGLVVSKQNGKIALQSTRLKLLMSVPMVSTAAAIPVPCDVLMVTTLAIPKRLNALKRMTGHGIKIWVLVSPAKISLALTTTKLK